MTATELPADAWGPLALPWRVVLRGDLVLGQAGPLWVERTGPGTDGQFYVQVLSAGAPWTGPVDPEQHVHVLVPLAEREAIRTLREAGIVSEVLDRAA